MCIRDSMMSVVRIEEANLSICLVVTSTTGTRVEVIYPGCNRKRSHYSCFISLASRQLITFIHMIPIIHQRFTPAGFKLNHPSRRLLILPGPPLWLIDSFSDFHSGRFCLLSVRPTLGPVRDRLNWLSVSLWRTLSTFLWCSRNFIYKWSWL